MFREHKRVMKNFKVGDHVKWNSEAGHVTGKIIKVHHSDFKYKGYTHHAAKKIHNMKLKVISPIILRHIKVRPFQRFK